MRRGLPWPVRAEWRVNPTPGKLVVEMAVKVGRRGRHDAGGFSLIELMTVITITAVLATIAIPIFQGYVMKARTTEATEFIGVIKLRQESYRSEFGQYAKINSNTTYPVPSAGFAPGTAAWFWQSPQDGEQQAFPGSVSPGDWNQLGANPGGMVRFGYGMAAGLPTEMSAAVTAPLPAGLGFTADHWYVIQAVSDLNGNGTSCLFEAYSQSKNIYYEPAKGWE